MVIFNTLHIWVETSRVGEDGDDNTPKKFFGFLFKELLKALIKSRNQSTAVYNYKVFTSILLGGGAPLVAVVSAGKAGRCAGQASVGNSSYATDSFAIHIITFGVSGVSEPAWHGKLPEICDALRRCGLILDYNIRLLMRLLTTNFQFPIVYLYHYL